MTRHDIWQKWWARLTSLAVVGLLISAASARADGWNDKSTLRFSSPVMVPGATLEAGEYVFKLMDLKTNRHMVQILSADESRVIAVTQAVPVKRSDVAGTTTLTFRATESGTPPALKAWYYPGTQYGHEFIYSGDEARQIAARSKTLVLSDDWAADDDASKGMLRMYDAKGTSQPWRADDAVVREWHDYTQHAQARSVTDAASADARRQATAPMLDASRKGVPVRLDDLEENAGQYIGQTITVDAEVEKILGPRAFTIDEPHWADLDGEILVHMPTALATLVRPDDQVTITGKVQPFVQAELEEEWAWFDDGSDVALHLARRPVLVATRVIGGDDNRALFISKTSPDSATETADRRRDADGSMAEARSPVTGLTALTSAAVGRSVELDAVKVERVVKDRGFFVSSEGRSVFVRRADGKAPMVRAGESVSVDGVLLTMPPTMRDEFRGADGRTSGVYVYATEVSAIS